MSSSLQLGPSAITDGVPEGPRRQPLFDRKIPLAAPFLPPKNLVLERIAQLLERPQLTCGQEVAQLEQQAARYLDVPECVAVSSCTAGLMLLWRVFGLRGEVIVPSFTFSATAHSLLWNGLEPVLADCDPGTFNLDSQSVERLITRATSAILAVHVFGCPAAVQELEEIARHRRLRLVFDGAHAFGARIDGRGVAGWGDATVFSLAPTKPLVAGEGGLIATRDPELARRLRQGRNYGIGRNYDCDLLGLSARMSEFHAAVALAGLPFVDEGIEQRSKLAALYRDRLSTTAGVHFQRQTPGGRHSFKDLGLLIEPARFGVSSRELASLLAAENIETRHYFDPPLHRQTLYRRYHRADRELLRVTEKVSARVVCLPLFAGLPEATVSAIADCVLGCRNETVQRRRSRAGTSTFVPSEQI